MPSPNPHPSPPHKTQATLTSSLFLFSILPTLASFTYTHPHAQPTTTPDPPTTIKLLCPAIGYTEIYLHRSQVNTKAQLLTHNLLPTTPIPRAPKKLHLLLPSPTSLHKIIRRQFTIPLLLPWGSLNAFPHLIHILHQAQPYKKFMLNPHPPHDPKLLQLKNSLLLQTALTSIPPYLSYSDDPLIAHLTLPQAIAQFTIADSNTSYTLLHQNNTFTIYPTHTPHTPSPTPSLPRVQVQFKTSHIAHAALTQQLDTSTAILNQQISLTGLIPFAQALHTIMLRTHTYLTTT
ncbi:MAG: hypothetical protein NZM04_05940 [Methylacidiphilales bacterium]|nr:hypothetical protein [Candidatus Methylacidiphilales bacterium]MDW8349650.1 hypothetical protein [Verrucomicrobiae bacterium]